VASAGAGILSGVDVLPFSDAEVADALGRGLIDAYIDGRAERLDVALGVLDRDDLVRAAEALAADSAVCGRSTTWVNRQRSPLDLLVRALGRSLPSPAAVYRRLETRHRRGPSVCRMS
jgi:hypothetical protein